MSLIYSVLCMIYHDQLCSVFYWQTVLVIYEVIFSISQIYYVLYVGMICLVKFGQTDLGFSLVHSRMSLIYSVLYVIYHGDR